MVPNGPKENCDADAAKYVMTLFGSCPSEGACKVVNYTTTLVSYGINVEAFSNLVTKKYGACVN